MGWLESIILGLVQGLTEFLPISSSAHILIISQLFHWQDPGAAFTAVTQIGTECAVLIYFRSDIARIVRTWFKSLRDSSVRSDPDARMGWLVIIGTIPISFFGLVFAHQIETIARNLWLVCGTLAVFGLVLGAADAIGSRTLTSQRMSWRDGIIIGIAQALALIPGVSRSGATISAGLFLGYTREAATRFAFLLAVPAVLLSGFYEATKIGKDGDTPAWGPTILATVIAFAVGFGVIAWLMKYLRTRSFRPFVFYRLALAAVLAVLLVTGVVG